jgi:uncharacterized protein YdeI (YjbR/CyaY-like superfamily)
MVTVTTAAPPNSIYPETTEDLRLWLVAHHSQKDGVWLVLWKKQSGRSRLDYDALVEEALCFGWIDSKPNKLDEDRSMLWLAPRKAGTNWSKLNKLRAERAIKTGKMTATGHAKIRAAKKDGSWNALDEVEALKLPKDLAEALKAHKCAAENFENFPRSTKRNILEWIGNAKTDLTRAKRISETAARAGVNERANQWRPLKTKKLRAL